MNPKDAIGDAILRHLYEVHSNAKSPKSAGKKISEVHKALRPLGYKQEDVASNLDYLVQKGWVREDIEALDACSCAQPRAPDFNEGRVRRRFAPTSCAPPTPSRWPARVSR